MGGVAVARFGYTSRPDMASKAVKLVVKEREGAGSRASRRLRREGFVPGVLYGSGDPHPFYVEERELRHALTGEHGLHAILDVVLDGKGKAHHAMLKDYQLDALRSNLVHVDLHEVRLDRPIQAQVALEAVGDSVGVSKGGVVQLVLREANVEALPLEMPDRLEIDVSALDIGDSARLADVTVPDGATLLDDEDTVVAMVLIPRVLEVEEEVEGEEAAAVEPGEGGEAETEAAGSGTGESESEES